MQVILKRKKIRRVWWKGQWWGLFRSECNENGVHQHVNEKSIKKFSASFNSHSTEKKRHNENPHSSWSLVGLKNINQFFKKSKLSNINLVSESAEKTNTLFTYIRLFINPIPQPKEIQTFHIRISYIFSKTITMKFDYLSIQLRNQRKYKPFT